VGLPIDLLACGVSVTSTDWMGGARPFYIESGMKSNIIIVDINTQVF
jgi:hypothetical protein